jgi:chemotaxis protein histidine kinase CheA
MVAYRIIQSLGGTIQVASQINEGTDIKVILPVSSK